MSLRKLLRVVLILVVLVLLGLRISRQWRFESGWWLFGAVTLAALLLLLLVVLVKNTFRKPHRPADDVPEHPLGLDS